MSTDVTKVFADRLSDLISLKGVKLKDIEEKTGISTGSISKYQNDAAEASISYLYELANYFEVTTDYLIGKTNNKTVENAAIGKELGLSDDAIREIKHHMYYNDVAFFETLNFLLKRYTPIKIISRYLHTVLTDQAIVLDQNGEVGPLTIEKLDEDPSSVNYLITMFHEGGIPQREIIEAATFNELKNVLTAAKEDFDNNNI